MSSYNRQHHGRPRPPPARNRPGFHPPPTNNVDQHYLAFLRSQAAHLDQQISALSHNRQSTHYPPTQHYPAAQQNYQPAQVSLQSSSNPPRRSRHRNPSRETSKWQFYAVKNGINGDDVYSTWAQAYPFCWNPSTPYFFPGSFCKGFNSYNQAWDFLLGVSPRSPSNNHNDNATMPQEPPEICIPSPTIV